MRKAIALSLVLAPCVLSSAFAGEPSPPPELVSARVAFAAAVTKNDEAGAAALTSFPLKNTVYRAPPKLNRAAFSTLFKDYRAMAACIRTKPLEHGRDGWEIDCDGNVLRFGLRGGKWRHTEYENVNE